MTGVIPQSIILGACVLTLQKIDKLKNVLFSLLKYFSNTWYKEDPDESELRHNDRLIVP